MRQPMVHWHQLALLVLAMTMRKTLSVHASSYERKRTPLKVKGSKPMRPSSQTEDGYSSRTEKYRSSSFPRRLQRDGGGNSEEEEGNDKNDKNNDRDGCNAKNEDCENASAWPSVIPSVVTLSPSTGPSEAESSPTSVPTPDPMPSPSLVRNPSPQSSPYSLPLAFSLWMGTPDGSFLSYPETAFEMSQNVIERAVIRSLWQMLCTEAVVEPMLNMESPGSSENAAALASYCVVHRHNVAVGQGPSWQSITKAESILWYQPSVSVETSSNAVISWTEWSVVFTIEQIGNFYYEIVQEKKDQDEDFDIVVISTEEDPLEIDEAAVEAMRQKVQSLLETSVMDGSLDVFLQANLVGEYVEDDGVAVAITARSSSLGNEVQVFGPFQKDPLPRPAAPSQTPSVSDDDYTGDVLIANTFSPKFWNFQRVGGFFLFVVMSFLYASALMLAKRRRALLQSAAALREAEQQPHDSFNDDESEKNKLILVHLDESSDIVKPAHHDMTEYTESNLQVATSVLPYSSIELLAGDLLSLRVDDIIDSDDDDDIGRSGEVLFATHK